MVEFQDRHQFLDFDIAENSMESCNDFRKLKFEAYASDNKS